MSWRRLRVLLERLPPESEYCTAIRNAAGEEALRELAASLPDDKFGPWSQTDVLLARIGDAIERLVWFKTDSKMPPDPWPRPGIQRATNVRPLNAYAEAYLREVERLNGAQPAPDWSPDLAEES